MMNRKLLSSLLAILLLMVTGCEKKATQPALQHRPNYLRMALLQPAAYRGDAQRFIAEHDKIEIATPESKLENSWRSVMAFCGTIECEVVSSSITARTADSVPSGGISLRVVPEDLQKLIGHVGTLGKIASNTSERVDETSSVVDTDAKIKNLTAFRDNLRAMLARPNLTVDNLIEIDKQLTDTQADLDSETAQRKILANETEKIAVDISFSVGPSGPSTGILAEVWNALLDAGATLLDSVETLVTVLIFLVPWGIVLFLIVWLVVKGRRRSRRHRTSPTS